MTLHVFHGGIHFPHVNVRLVASAVVLLAVALAAGVLIGRSTKTAAVPAEGVSERVARMFDGKLAALNRGDWKAFGGYWAGDAILEEPTSQMYAKGRQQIVALNQGIASLGTRMYRVSPCIQIGNIAACAVKGGYGAARSDPGGLSWIDVVELGDNSKITHMWSGFTAASDTAG